MTKSTFIPLLLSFLVFPLFGYSQSQCDAPVTGPVSLPIRNVSLIEPVIRRGVALAVGNPPQNLAFDVQPNVNNTFVYDSSGLCDANTPPIQCLGRNGGAYKESSSSTWMSLDLSKDDHTKELPSFNLTRDLFGTDTLQLNASTSTSKFPFHVPRGRHMGINMHSLGLGRDSTILNALYNSGTIASRSWSVFGGLTGATVDHQMDGNLVLGGYDSAKFTGDNHTEKITSNSACPTSLVATVTNIEIESAGQSVSLLGEQLDSAIRFCIDPSFPIITIPKEAGDIFREKSTVADELGRSFGLNIYGLVYAANSVYKGDLTLTFQSGLKITIPNHQLVIPDISVDPEGSTIFNDTTREVLLNPLQEINKNDMLLLGKTFLTSAYLNVNYDTGTFAMWQATPTTEENLVGVGKSSGGCRIVSNTTSNPTNSTAISPASSKFKISTAAIAGIAIGATAGLAMIAAVTFFWLMHRRRRNGHHGTSQIVPQADTAVFKSELPAENVATSHYPARYNLPSRDLQEMPGDQAYTIDASRRI